MSTYSKQSDQNRAEWKSIFLHTLSLSWKMLTFMTAVLCVSIIKSDFILFIISFTMIALIIDFARKCAISFRDGDLLEATLIHRRPLGNIPLGISINGKARLSQTKLRVSEVRFLIPNQSLFGKYRSTRYEPPVIGQKIYLYHADRFGDFCYVDERQFIMKSR